VRAPNRTLTTMAVGFLVLDAVLLLYGGLAWGREPLTLAGAACAGGAVLVVLGWRRYRRTLVELDAARDEMRREVESIRALLQSHHFNN